MTGIVVLPAYARELGCIVDHMEDGVPVIGCDYGVQVMGRPGLWHGGVLASMLEIAALCGVRAAPGVGQQRLKPVNVTTQYMRAGLEQRTYAVGHVVRQGRRLVNVTAEAWQDDRSRLLATAQIHVMIAPEKD